MPTPAFDLVCSSSPLCPLQLCKSSCWLIDGIWQKVKGQMPTSSWKHVYGHEHIKKNEIIMQSVVYSLIFLWFFLHNQWHFQVFLLLTCCREWTMYIHEKNEIIMVSVIQSDFHLMHHKGTGKFLQIKRKVKSKKPHHKYVGSHLYTHILRGLQSPCQLFRIELFL